MIIIHQNKLSENIQNYNPERLDIGLIKDLFTKYGETSQTGLIDQLDQFLHAVGIRDTSEYFEGDEFRESGVNSIEEIRDIFCSRYFFGCEADDPMNALATRCKTLLDGAEMNAMFASDIGHWDVTDMNSVLPEAWELVEEGLLDTEEFSAFVFGNVVEFYGRVNPGVFAGTTVEDQASVHLSTLGVKSDQ